MSSTLFLTNVTCIDFAYINTRGCAVGKSVNPIIRVTGGVVTDEQVVVDFSKGKKAIKQHIDHKEYGIDHKLVVPVDMKNCIDYQDSTVTITTLELTVKLPKNAVYVASVLTNQAIDEMGFEKAFALELEYFLNNKQPELLHSISIVQGHNQRYDILKALCPENVSFMVEKSFSYTHGLAKSSSWGCQNILHGHSSFLVLYSNNPAMSNEIKDLADMMATYIDQSYIVCKDHLGAIEDSPLEISYTAAERGDFRLLTKDVVLPIPKEPTIENIVEFVLASYQDELTNLGVNYVAISEGLWKGCILPVKGNEHGN